MKKRKLAKMKKRKLVITLNSGIIDLIKIPKGVKLEIRDYDLIKNDADKEVHKNKLRTDDLGREYVELIWTKKDVMVS